MDKTIQYIKNEEWWIDYVEDRKIYLFKLAQKSFKSNSIDKKIGGMLIYNQIIEQMLKEIVIASVNYTKAEILPTIMVFDIDLEKATFGKLIEYFKQYSTQEMNYELLLLYLKKLNKERNVVVHNVFGIDKIEKLNDQLTDFGNLAYEVLILLFQYYDEVCWRLVELHERFDFDVVKNIKRPAEIVLNSGLNTQSKRNTNNEK